MIPFFNSKIEFLPLLIYVVAYTMALFVAMPFHEFAHAYAARKEGDYTATALKRCTLRPLAHVDISGLICLFFFGFGWAKPVPVDERNFRRGKLSKFIVSIAGIVTNLILGVVFMFIYVLIFKLNPNFYDSSLYGTLLYNFLNLSISLNFSLAFFNLLPIHPLDGFKIVETFSKWNSPVVEYLRRYSSIIYIIFIISGIYAYYFQYTAYFCIENLLKLMLKLLGVTNGV